MFSVHGQASAAGLFQALSSGEIATRETNLVTGVLIAALGVIGRALAAWWPGRSSQVIVPTAAAAPLRRYRHERSRARGPEL